MDILDLTALELGEKIKNREISVSEALLTVLDRIDQREERLHCYITVTRDEALKRAGKVQKMIDEGHLTSPLAGVPMAVKDNICTKGIRTTCASRMLAGFVPGYSATAYDRLMNAGAVLIGKTNMDEFAMGSTTETSFFGVTRNPWNESHVPGGSSGGSAAAVAAGECFFALGSDTGGSIRQPAAHCGVIGLKPTYSAVSRNGLIAYASSLDQIGPIGKDAADIAAVMDIIADRDPMDSTSSGKAYGDDPGTCREALTKEFRGLKIGIPRDYSGTGLDPEIERAVRRAAKVFEEQGAYVEEFDLPLVEEAVPIYYIIATAQASSNLERYDGIKYGYRTSDVWDLHPMYRKTRSEGFGREVKRRILLGSFVLSSGYYEAYYQKALKGRTLVKQVFDKAFEQYDLLLGPVAPTTAPKLSESLGDPLKMALSDVYTVSANLAGLPAISLPCGIHSNGLPIGLQLTAHHFQEKKLITAASRFAAVAKP